MMGSEISKSDQTKNFLLLSFEPIHDANKKKSSPSPFLWPSPTNRNSPLVFCDGLTFTVTLPFVARYGLHPVMGGFGTVVGSVAPKRIEEEKNAGEKLFSFRVRTGFASLCRCLWRWVGVVYSMFWPGGGWTSDGKGKDGRTGRIAIVVPSVYLFFFSWFPWLSLLLLLPLRTVRPPPMRLTRWWWWIPITQGSKGKRHRWLP